MRNEKEKSGRNLRSVLCRRRGEILSFLLAALAAFGWTLSTGSLVSLGPDCRLYLSIAENFLSTGHFIQTTRDIEGFVVPFGFPLLLTVLRLFRLTPAMLVILQHFLLGGECQLLYLAEKNRFGRGGIAPVLFFLALFRAHVELNNLYLEYPFLFFLCWILYLLSKEDMPEEKKLTRLNIAGFCAFVIRPVLIIVWAPMVAYTLYRLLKKSFPWKRGAALVTAFLLLLVGNSAVNYRETGHWVLMENYSGADIYAANNPNTKTYHYVARALPDFVDEQYYEIEEDTTLDQTERNAVFKAAYTQWIWENIPQFLKNTGAKFRSVILDYWLYAPLLALLGFSLSLRGADKPRKWQYAAELGTNIALAVATSIGLIMGRYAVPIWPLTSLHLAAIYHFARRGYMAKKGERTPVA